LAFSRAALSGMTLSMIEAIGPMRLSRRGMGDSLVRNAQAMNRNGSCRKVVFSPPVKL
jgi:hypothetical protein